MSEMMEQAASEEMETQETETVQAQTVHAMEEENPMAAKRRQWSAFVEGPSGFLYRIQAGEDDD